jgi:hypothetical protein
MHFMRLARELVASLLAESATAPFFKGRLTIITNG